MKIRKNEGKLKKDEDKSFVVINSVDIQKQNENLEETSETVSIDGNENYNISSHSIQQKTKTKIYN